MSRYVQAGHSATSPISNLHRKTLPLAMYVGSNGYVQNGGFVIQPIPELQKRAMQGPRAIVMHRTASSGIAGPLQSYQKTGIDTHFNQWDEATAEQRQSIRTLIGFLKNTYFLTDDDVYAHDEISYKTLGEGSGMYDGGAMGGLRRPPPFYDFSGD